MAAATACSRSGPGSVSTISIAIAAAAAAASAAAGYLASHLSPRLMAGGHPSPALTELAQVHSYTTAFWWAAGIFAAGSVLAALLFRPARDKSRASDDGITSAARI